MGVVYRARHETTGTLVALKTLRVQAPELYASFRREVHVLAGLQHPGIVRIFDHGLTDGTPWYAMELVDGETLTRAIRPTPAPRPVPATETDGASFAGLSPDLAPLCENSALPLAEQLRVFRRICRALDFIHSRGVIHRDIKPDNILVQAGGMPVLVDFGIVASFGGGAGREVLDLANTAAGTLAYKAPEQRLGRLVDARADLFSLGCVLYESLTGRLPFGLTGVHALSIAPPPPSTHVPDLPPAIDDLVARLLARNPHDRLGYAHEVEALLGDVVDLASRRDPAPTSGHGFAYLYRPELAGRDDVAGRLGSVLDDARSGSGAKVFVTGESGAGKTRMLLELAARAAEKGMRVIASDCAPVATTEADAGVLGAPLHVFRSLLVSVADACRARDPEAARRFLGEHGRVLAPYEPALASLVEELDAKVPEALPADAARARLFASLTGLLVDFARDAPLLLVLDDLQWADELSTEFLASLRPADLALAPLAVVGSYRIEEMTDALRAMTREPGVVHEPLARFDRKAVGAMVAGMLALHTPPSPLVDFLHGESSGNPFFIAEYLRAAIADGLLVRDAAGGWALRSETGLREAIALPPTLGALIARRLEGLDATCLRALSAAAVLGRDFDVELVSRTADLEVAAVLDAYGELRQRQIVEEDESGASRFVHDKLRETAYERIETGAGSQNGTYLAELHGRAADALELRYAGPEIDAHWGAFGYHHSKAARPTRAAECFERAGDHARRSFANRDAIRFYRLALAQLPNGAPGEAASRIQEAVGDLLLLQGAVDDARTALAAAFEATPAPDRLLRARRRRKLARTWERQHRHAEALALYAAAEEELGAIAPGPAARGGDTAAPWWNEYVQIQVDKAWDLYWLARVDDLAVLVERVRPVVERHGRPAQRAQFFQALVHMNLRRDRYGIADETIAHARASLVAAEDAGDLREVALARFFLAFPLMFRAFEEEAEPLFVEALKGAERVGDATLQARFLSYYTILHRRLGRVGDVRATAERARTIGGERNMFDYVGAAHANLCWASWKDGRPDEVEQHAASTFASWGKLPAAYPYPLQWLVRMPLAIHLCQETRWDEAFEHWAFLLRPDQHLLPLDLRETIESALVARSAEATRRVIELSTELRYA
jgi:hypothetical protein